MDEQLINAIESRDIERVKATSRYPTSSKKFAAAETLRSLHPSISNQQASI
jgi:hypothetical protein